MRLNVNGFSGTKYEFTGVHTIMNSMGAKIPNLETRQRPYNKVFERHVPPGLVTLRQSGESGRDRTVCLFKGCLQHVIKRKNSVWFCICDGDDKESPSTVAMMDVESKILSDWDHYWEITQDCEETTNIFYFNDTHKIQFSILRSNPEAIDPTNFN